MVEYIAKKTTDKNGSVRTYYYKTYKDGRKVHVNQQLERQWWRRRMRRCWWRWQWSSRPSFLSLRR